MVEQLTLNQRVVGSIPTRPTIKSKNYITFPPSVNVIGLFISKHIVELEGPQGLRLIKGFHDEALKGEWKGFRSSRLTREWRVIYKVECKQFEVYVIDVNHHDYHK